MQRIPLPAQKPKRRLTAQTKRRMSIAKKGRPLSQEHCAALKLAWTLERRRAFAAQRRQWWAERKRIWNGD